jgi:Phytanoyl-CoA dioxygenase (PhyH)
MSATTWGSVASPGSASPAIALTDRTDGSQWRNRLAAGRNVGRVVHEVFDDAQVEGFVRDGAIKLSGAFPREVADECRSRLWAATGCDEHDPATWTRPVIRIDYRDDPPFAAAATSPRLHAAFDQLAGPGRWRPRTGLGTFPIRFPSAADPGDAGWHIESTGVGPDGRPRIDPASRERVLLLLFLFSEVGPDDAPTRVRLGSHRDAAAALADAGPDGADFFDVASRLGASAERPETPATGAPGDVWLCHPFVVHAAQAHHGRRPRFMAQPPLPGTQDIDPGRPAQQQSPVERAIAGVLG